MATLRRLLLSEEISVDVARADYFCDVVSLVFKQGDECLAYH